LSDVGSLELPVRKADYAENIYWVFGVVLKDNVSFEAKEAMRRLGQYKIGVALIFGRCMNSLS